MTDRLELIAAFGAAASDCDRAAVLLILSDAHLLEAQQALRVGCARAKFEAGIDFVNCRVALLEARRDASGLLPAEVAIHAERFRAEMARFVAAGGA